MKTVFLFALVFALTGCASRIGSVSAEVVSIRKVEERYEITGWWGVYTEVVYRITPYRGSPKEIKRIYGDEDPEILTRKPGQMVRLRLQPEER